MKTCVFARLMVGVFAAALLGLAGCNTVEGAGEDIQAAGEGISDTSRDVRE